MAAAGAYSDAAGYRELVVSLQTQKEWPPVVPDQQAAPVSPLSYHHLGFVCRDVAASIAFYSKLGFNPTAGDPASAKGEGIVRLAHGSGLELHLIQADVDPSGSANILMDDPQVKAPGHTHASWTVPSVPGVKAFLASIGVELSGTRSTLAVFVRDPDRTTLEFERNDGGDEPPAAFSPEHIGNKRPLDHVGTRVRAPYQRHLDWYSRNLGFTGLVRTYTADENPLKNNPPWITRSAAGVDINWIINASTAPEGAEAAENVLVEAGGLRAGILYAAFSISESAEAALAALRANGVDCILDSELAGGAAWGDFPPSAIRLLAGGSVLVRDLNGNIVRLVPPPPGR